MGYTVWRYPLAAASYSVQASTDLLTWDVETVPLTNTPSFFQVRPTVPIPQAKRQFFRLMISDP